MSTRALVYVIGYGYEHAVIYAVIYKHWDGDALGAELKELLAPLTIVNGLTFKDITAQEPISRVNGPDELAARLVWALKQRHPVGDVYMAPCSWPPQDMGQEYVYLVLAPYGEGRVSVFYYPRLVKLFGPLTSEEAREILAGLAKEGGKREDLAKRYYEAIQALRIPNKPHTITDAVLATLQTIITKPDYHTIVIAMETLSVLGWMFSSMGMRKMGTEIVNSVLLLDHMVEGAVIAPARVGEQGQG